METRSKKQRIAIIEQCIMTAVGLRHLLMNIRNKHFEFCFFRSVDNLTQAVEKERFDTIIVCLSGKRESRLEYLSAISQMARCYPNLVRIVLANDDAEAKLIRYLSPVYIHGVLSKSTSLPMMRHSIQALLTDPVSDYAITTASQQQQGYHGLSPTENTLLRYMAYGYSLPEIADRLDRNIKTVRAHKFNVMNKLGATSDSQLLNAADLIVSLPERERSTSSYYPS